jgi:hypothetical protein
MPISSQPSLSPYPHHKMLIGQKKASPSRTVNFLNFRHDAHHIWEPASC